ncbi:hypothetical protein B0H17DRAFT_1176846 [Mycena rosella]|uniref:Uncharacterized protein n=1 Tax=Mycena rosella TaxID=1033263 RepID=A0AAD7DWU9_MYCRO|nr:hypothetical protein B0H17DRAFT_1176846 [Mycena rosella]
MATPGPPPAASRTRDWVRTAEPGSGSAFSGLGRGGRGGGGGGGGGRGRSRGGRGRGGGGGGGSASTPRAPSTADKPAASEGSTSRPAATTSTPAPAPATEKPSAPPATPARSKAHGRKTSRSVVPTVVVGPVSPSAEVPATTSTPRPSNRRRRSQQLTKGNGTPAAGLKVNVPPLDDNLLRPQNRLVPHSAPPPSKDTPPHLAGAFDMRNNIDALVERVRAVAMDNRPSTPGSHIDWAGDDDEGLPDLDDWGVTTGTSVGDKDEMISPIIVDGLKPLPEPVAKPPTPLGDRKEDVVVPFVMKDQQKPPTAVQTPLHPSLPPKPTPGPVSHQPQSASGKNNAAKEPAAAADASEPPASVDGTPDVKPGEKQAKQDVDDAAWDSGREGLAASIHAPALSNSLSAPSNLSTPPTQPRNFNPTHNRAQTIGRAFPQSAPVNFNSRFPRSGTSTPRGGYSPGGQHARTHSSPPAGSVLNNNHRPPHARPVITGDAISRLARTIARTPQISASNI